MKKWMNKTLVSHTPVLLAIKLAANKFMSAVSFFVHSICSILLKQNPYIKSKSQSVE